MSDTWSDIQEHKRRQESLRERLAKRRRERQGINVSEGDGSTTMNTALKRGTATPPPSSPQSIEETSTAAKAAELVKVDPLLESNLIECLWDSTFILPVDSLNILNHLLKNLDAVAQELNKDTDEKSASKKRKRESESSDTLTKAAPATNKAKTAESEDDLQALLSMPTMKELETKKVGTDILDLLNVPSHREQNTVAKFRSQGGAFVHEFCEHGTRAECQKNKPTETCKKVKI
ncbi:N6-adenosine-methyltransferase 70 kDa subunit [Exaiptasia diaphana]|nr:N6-adenosine-methyltransferase 70 kDa subunit [Exaiptasia diaphana]